MVTVSRKRMAVLALTVLAAAMFVGPAAFAQEGEEAVVGNLSVGDGLRALGLALGAGIAIAGSAIATGRVQAAVGAGGTGALAEKPDLFTLILILIAIPETLVVFGFVIAFLLYGAL
jgi:V/A-type H+-transporting ATPase subunit K